MVTPRSDNKSATDFDVIDEFVARHGLDLGVAAEAMALDDLAFARMIVSPDVPRSEVVRLAAGMTPGQVIVAATRTSARIMGLDDLGMVAPGKSADFVVLDANPLDDIKNTRKISAVYLRGAAVDRSQPVK